MIATVPIVDTNQLLDIIIQNQPLWYKEEDEEGKICHVSQT